MKKKKIKVVELVQTCWSCPSQWDGKTDDGMEVYIRFRHGHLGVDLQGDGQDDNVLYWKRIFDYSDNRMADGSMDTDEMMAITHSVIKWRLSSRPYLSESEE